MDVALTILGSSSAIPTKTRNTTAQFLKFDAKYFLIDCGESTINRLISNELPYGKIEAIFISHLHSDHILGLPGMLSSYYLQSRTRPLKIFSPPGLQKLIEPLTGPTADFPFVVEWIEIPTEGGDIIYDSFDLIVSTIPMNHRIPCVGFKFLEKERVPNVSKEAIKKYDMTIHQILEAKKGLPITLKNGSLVPNEQLILPSQKLKSYAFCSDTSFFESIIPFVKNVDLLYHEATYLNDKKDLAKARGHSTALEAALIANKAEVGQLIIGHFSSRYKNAKPLEDEARSVFENTFAAEDGAVFTV